MTSTKDDNDAIFPRETAMAIAALVEEIEAVLRERAALVEQLETLAEAPGAPRDAHLNVSRQQTLEAQLARVTQRQEMLLFDLQALVPPEDAP